MKRIVCILICCIRIMQLFAQHPTCDGNRYMNNAFSAVTTTVNVQYGQNYTMNSVLQNLVMDIAQPSGDVAVKRPLILFIHGGAFVQGARSDGNDFCLAFAKKGFVTATIDYRLIDISLATADSTTIAKGLIYAISDAKAAIRFFVEDAATTNNYKIDTNYIFVAGLSAGAITASHVAYLDPTDNIPAYFLNLLMVNGGFSGNSSSNTSYTTPIRGVINASGAMWRQEWMSSGEPPIFSVHDNLDTIVPCNYGKSKAFSFPVYMYGSCVMQQEANSKGIFNQIFINNSNGHGAYLNSSPLVDTVTQKISNFLYKVMCTDITSVNKTETSKDEFTLYPNPANGTLTVSISENPIAENQIQIFNTLGILFKEISVRQSTQINISDLPSGLYWVRLKNSQQQVLKFIKQ